MFILVVVSGRGVEDFYVLDVHSDSDVGPQSRPCHNSICTLHGFLQDDKHTLHFNEENVTRDKECLRQKFDIKWEVVVTSMGREN